MINIKRTHKLFLLFGIAFFITAVSFSQTIIQPEASRELEEAAKEQVAYWENELALTAKQLSLMEDKIIEFVFKKDKVLQSNLEKEVKTQKLVDLQILENRDMRDILTKPQYDRYIMLQKQNIRQQANRE